MKKKILITERQLEIIVESETILNTTVKKIVGYLKKYYEPVVGVFPGKEEYTTGGLITNKIDGTTMSPKALKDHLKYKFGNLKDEFLRQLISDWFDDKIVDGQMLSKKMTM